MRYAIALLLLAVPGAMGQNETSSTMKPLSCSVLDGALICADKNGAVYPMLGTGTAAPFDVKPKEWDTVEHSGYECCGSGATAEAADRDLSWKFPGKRVHHRTCADPTRFLLMSEDKRWHCLALGGRP